MITIILVLLWAAFLITLIVNQIRYCRKEIFDFQNFDIVDIPYVTMDIQGNLMNMIVDTGCGISILNEPAIRNCELCYKDTNRAVSLSAVTDDKIEGKAITIDFNIGRKEISEDFFLHGTEDFGNFGKMYGITIHGLLGSSFFDNNACNIDFKTHTLTIV